MLSAEISPAPGKLARAAAVRQLEQLEAESIFILREVAAEFRNPVALYSGGKDSSVLLRLALKAFYPAPPPFPFLHIDTTWNFKELIAFRDAAARSAGVRLLVHVNEEGLRAGVSPLNHAEAVYREIMLGQALRQAIATHGFDAVIASTRRDEEGTCTKERVFSVRDAEGRWDPMRQRPQFWHTYNTQLAPGQSMRVFPLAAWSEIDVWTYIDVEGIAVAPLYFARERPVVERGGAMIVVDDARLPLAAHEKPELRRVRFRKLGCYPLTEAVPSQAVDAAQIIAELAGKAMSDRGRTTGHGGQRPPSVNTSDASTQEGRS